MKERCNRTRSCRRTPVAIACWVIASDEVVCYQTMDISETGICLTTSNPLPVGTIVELQLFLPHSASPLSVTAEVVWSSLDGDGTMGLQFLERDAKVLTTLRQVAQQGVRKTG